MFCKSLNSARARLARVSARTRFFSENESLGSASKTNSLGSASFTSLVGTMIAEVRSFLHFLMLITISLLTSRDVPIINIVTGHVMYHMVSRCRR